MRAGNKNRSLRPRTSPTRNSAVPPESDLATSEKEESVSSQAITADPATLEALRAAKPAAATPEVAAPEVAAPAKITPAEVLAAGEAFSDQDEDDEDEEDDDEAPAAKVEAAPAKVEPVVAKKAEEPKKAEPVVAKKVEPVAAKKAEEPKKVEPVAAKKSEAPVAAKKSEPAPSKKGEPVKVADAKKIDESATTIRSERPATNDGDQRSGNKKKGNKNSEGAKVDAKRSGSEEVDDSSISAEFFRREGDSLPPMVDAHGEHEDHDEAGGVHVLSPATIARRARLRRVVAGVVAFAGVITLAVVGKTLAASKQPATSLPIKPSVTQEAKVEVKQPEVKQPEVKAPPAPEKTAEVAAVPAPTASASADVAKAEPAPTADPKAVEDPKKVEPGGGDAKALTKEAESFLNRGNRKEAMAKAREAIAADPTQALPYLLLGSALQDSGKWKDGIDAYSDCVRTATKGPVGDCRQMGGHK